MSAVRDATTSRSFKAVRFRDNGNALRVANALRFRDAGNVLRGSAGSASSLSATLSADYVSGAVNSSASRPVTTRLVTAIPSGAVDPCTFAWAQTDATAGWTINNPSSASTTFTAASLAPGSDLDGTFACTVTDAGGHSVVTAEVSAHAMNISSGGTGPLP